MISNRQLNSRVIQFKQKFLLDWLRFEQTVIFYPCLHFYSTRKRTFSETTPTLRTFRPRSGFLVGSFPETIRTSSSGRPTTAGSITPISSGSQNPVKTDIITKPYDTYHGCQSVTPDGPSGLI